MTTQFSAAPQFLGYYYQIRYALYLIVSGRPGLRLAIEGTDDIEVKPEADLGTLFQLKHHLKGGPLTDTHKDLWKTVLIWSTYIAEGRIPIDETKLLLVTNAPTVPGSIPNLLTEKSRGVESALNKMREVSSKSTQSLQDAFNKFKSLTANQQEALVRAIYVLDLAPDVETIEERIKEELVGVLPEHRNYLMESLEGWWITTVIRHLKWRDPEYISALDVHSWIADRNSIMPQGFLPHIHSNDRPDESNAENVPLYIKQLIRIGIQGIGLNNAKRDYIRAFRERSDWVHHKLIFQSDDEQYDNKLIDEWENLLGLIESEFFEEHGMSIADASEEMCRKFGQRLYNKVCQLDLTLKTFSIERYVVRGSYHMLADMNPPSVGWHPNFRYILDELLTPA